MRARHRLSKLLLRHGLVYDASAWTLAHDAWLRRQRFDSRPLALAFDESYAAVLQAKTRRDRLDQAIAEIAYEPPFVGVVGRLVCLRGVSTLTALALSSATGRASGRNRLAPSSASPRAKTRAGSGAGRARSPRPATRTCAGCSSRRPGSSGDRYLRAQRSHAAGRASGPPSVLAPTRALAGCISAGTPSSGAASGGRSLRSPSPASSQATAGRSRPCRPITVHGSARRAHRRNRREKRPAVQLRAAQLGDTRP